MTRKKLPSAATLTLAVDPVLLAICRKSRTNAEKSSSLTMEATFRIMEQAGKGEYGGNRDDLTVIRSDATKSKSLARIILAKSLGARPKRPADGGEATAYNAFQADERLIREGFVIAGTLLSLDEFVTFDATNHTATILAEHLIEGRLHNYVSAVNRSRPMVFGGKPYSFKFVDGSGDKPRAVTIKNSLAFLKATFPPATGGSGRTSGASSFDAKLTAFLAHADRKELFAVRARIDAALGLATKTKKTTKKMEAAA